MKIELLIKITTTIFLISILIFSVSAQQPKTVTDFYLALPGGVNGIEGADINGFDNDFFFYSNERNESKESITKYRKSLIKIADLKNGYLRLESDEWDGWVEIALFKKEDEAYLFALSQVENKGPGIAGDIIFLTYSQGKWTNVTKKVFSSNPSPDDGYFKLPRVGTTVEFICGDERGDESQPDCQSGKTLAEFKWNKTKFIK